MRQYGCKLNQERRDRSSHTRKLLWPWHPGLLCLLLGVVSIPCGPAAYYLVTYFGGRGTIPLALAANLSVLLGLSGSMVSLLCFLLLYQLFHTPYHGPGYISTVLVAVCVSIAHYPILLQMPPNGRIWTDGFIAGITSRANLPKLQTWAIERLTEYQQGILKTRDPKYSSPLSRAQLDPAIIPEYVWKIGGNPPSEGVNIATIPGAIVNPERLLDDTGQNFGGYCLAISWYNFGLLVGSPPDFQSQSDGQQQWTHPWSVREIHPGMFVYYIEK